MKFMIFLVFCVLRNAHSINDFSMWIKFLSVCIWNGHTYYTIEYWLLLYAHNQNVYAIVPAHCACVSSFLFCAAFLLCGLCVWERVFSALYHLLERLCFTRNTPFQMCTAAAVQCVLTTYARFTLPCTGKHIRKRKICWIRIRWKRSIQRVRRANRSFCTDVTAVWLRHIRSVRSKSVARTIRWRQRL